MIIENIKTPLSKTCDVLVCGGGFAGISAALAAARQGKKVTLLEKQFMLGGLATAGLVTIYLPLCDGLGRQVSFGIAEELFRLSIQMGYEDKYPENWLENKGTRTEKDKRFVVQYNAQFFAILAEQLLIKENVEILYGSYAVATDVKDSHFSSAPCKTFKQGNVLASWYYSFEESNFKLNTLGFSDIPEEERNTENTVELLVNERFAGLQCDELSRMTQLSHASILNDIIKKRENGCNVIPTTIATIPQIRMTRKIVGEYELDENEKHTYFKDSIGMVSNWKKRGPVYEVPFRTLYSRKIKNLIVAGRCTSVTEQMWDIMRVIPCCAVTGEAAGVAAAISDDFSVLDVCKLQKILKENGVILHECDL